MNNTPMTESLSTAENKLAEVLPPPDTQRKAELPEPEPATPRPPASRSKLPMPDPAKLAALKLPKPSPDVLVKPAGLELTEKEKEVAGKLPLQWSHLLTGNAVLVPDAVRKMAGADDPTLSPDEQDYRIYTAINRSWYAEHRGATREQVRAEWPALRRRLAEELHVADDERELFMALSAAYDEEKLRKAAEEVYARVYQAGLARADYPDLSDIINPLPQEYRDAARAVAAQAAAEAQALRDEHSILVKELSKGMKSFTLVEDKPYPDPALLMATPSLLYAVDALADMNPREKQLVMYMAVQDSRAQRDPEEQLVKRVFRGSRRGSSAISFGLFQAVNHLGVATLDNIGGFFDNRVGRAMQSTAAKWDKRLRVLNEIRQVTQQEVMPLLRPDSSAAESYMLAAAESIPAAVLACCGGAGFFTLTASGMGEAVGAARLRSPETPQQMQLAAGVVGGAVQASIYMGLSRFGGKLLEKNINNFMKSCGLGLGQFSWGALNAMSGMTAEGVRLMLAGKAAHAVDLTTQELASRAAGTASGIKWEEFGHNLTDLEANMREAAAMLPFLLIGAGRVAMRHFRAPHELVGDGSRLLDWGIKERTVDLIVNERNIDRKGEMLREALSGSKMWSAPGFIFEAIKALRLLNTEYFKGFDSPEVVRDFLKIPAESSIVKRADYGERTYEDMLKTRGHAQERSGLTLTRPTPRLKEALALWDEWWTRSHIDAHSSRLQLGEWQLRFGAESSRYERSLRYLDELKMGKDAVPLRVRPFAAYMPHAEPERRALLRDRVAELQDLSYQFLMNVNPLESMLSKEHSVERIRAEAERTRAEFLANVGKAVVRAGLGMPHKRIIAKFCDWFQGYYMRKKYRERTRGARIDWIREVPPDYLRKMSEHAPHFEHLNYSAYPELLEAYRIYLGVRTNTELLMELLPMTEDFQTAVSRGLSPAQAYAHLIERELGYRADKVKDYPPAELAQSANVTPMQEYCAQNERMCREFMQLTGAQLEQQTGDDGQTYWRLRRPDGSFSRWHESAAFAMNDVAANAALTFLPFGRGIHEYWAETAHRGRVDLTQLPLAKEQDFSGYDHLCLRALRDLTTHWMESAPYLQPGFRAERLRRQFILNSNYGDGLTPVYRGDDPGDFPYLVFDAHTTSTPLGMATARFYTAWHRLLYSGTVTWEEAAGFLRLLGGEPARECEELLADGKAGDKTSALADILARFSTRYFLMKLPQLPLPASVKEWVGLAPFCPPVKEMPPQRVVHLGENQTGIVRYSNRRVAARMHELLPDVAELRQRFAEQPLPDARMQALLENMMGLNPVMNAEQTWCYRYCGEEAVQNMPQSMVNLLQSPQAAIERMSAEEWQVLREYLQPFCEQNPPPGMPEGADAVECAVALLDEALRRAPYLHFMSFAGDARGRLLCLEIPNPVTDVHFEAEEPHTGLPPFPYMRWVKDEGVYKDKESALVPEVADADTRYALRMLDILRRYPADLPYATAEGIFWRQQTYGGKDGAIPGGMELHKAYRALLRLRVMLRDVGELCAEKKVDSLNFGGVEIPRVTRNELICPELHNIWVYRQMAHGWLGRSLTDVCRLMPGDLAAPDFRVRHPYVVEVRHGVYKAGFKTLRTAEDPLACAAPLQSFIHGAHHESSETNRKKWADSFLQHSLDTLCQLAEEDMSFMEHRYCNGLSLTELLMRLFEDSHFSFGVLGQRSINDLSGPELKALRLAADMIACIAAPYSATDPRSVKAFTRLKETVQRIRRDESQREALEHILTRGGYYLKEKIGPYTIIIPDKVPKDE